MRTVWLIIFLLLSTSNLWAQEVSIKDGNVYFRTAQDQTVQVTASGRDSTPSLSPDGKSIVFVRATPQLLVSTGMGDIQATELWLIHVDTKKAELLVRGKEAQKIEKTIAGIESPSFSPDGRSIYFVSAAWATSGSIQRLLLRTKEVRFVTDGVSFRVIPKGNHKGSLLVDRALIKFDKNGDSLGRDVYLWLVSADGKPIQEIGQTDSKAAQEFRERHTK